MVAARFAIAVHSNRLSIQDRPRNRWIAISGRWRGPYTVKNRSPKKQKPVEVMIGIADQLPGFLGRRVRADGVIDAIILAKRHLTASAINRRAGGKNERLDPIVAGKFEQLQRAFDVDGLIDERGSRSRANPRPCGKMADDVRGGSRV